jgi:tetratricopeptide (TPR) repeat protein
MMVGDRATALRLAHLHLRMGSLALARAELDLLGGTGELPAPALVDLAEARWRTGDLDGAGEAAGRALERATNNPLALVIAAEAAAAAGHRARADELAATAIESLQTTLDTVFAGMPRSQVWPGDPEMEAVVAEVPDLASETDVAGPAAASEAVAEGRAALATGNIVDAALHLSLAIRLEPGLAADVLAAIGDGGSTPLLALVAGDALRLLGRDAEAAACYERARGRPPQGDRAEPG